MSFAEQRSQCLSSRKLYEDPDFPAHPSSIHPQSDTPSDWLWKRPKDLCASPKFIKDGATRFDLAQGEMGDCWFVAAAAILATKPQLFNRVVPQEQGFVKEYAGIFHFNFWRFGEWVEVVIDDRLPATVDGDLRFGRNRTEPDEFWGPLLEKAYAKLHGSYHALNVGYMRDALVDFCGGLSESFLLRDTEEVPPNLFDLLRDSYSMGSMMGVGIWNDTGGTTEEELWNGLYKGHAYSVTGVVECRIQGWSTKLVRLRNPWGRKEWNGAWSDGSEEWSSVQDEEKAKLGITVSDDGEFWMKFEDLLRNFSLIEFVHMGPDSFMHDFDETKPKKSWNEVKFHGRWVNGVNAGGCGLFSGKKDLYYTNPHYFVTLFCPDVDNMADLKECTCIVSLMQKDYRRRKTTPGQTRIIMRFDVHAVRSGNAEFLHDESFFDKTKLKKQFSTRTLLREITCRLSLDLGTYVIVPNTLQPHKEAEFLLRVFTYSTAQSQEISEPTGEITPSIDNPAPVKPVGNLSSEFFWHYAAEDHVVDARELRDLLNELARNELRETTAFGVETCRCLIAMFGNRQEGTVDFVQAGNLWDEILFWRILFREYDRDDSGCIETYELRNVFRRIGLSLSFECLSILAVRYGGKDRTLFFEDFVLCLARASIMLEVFQSNCNSDEKAVTMGLEEWMRSALYY